VAYAPDGRHLYTADGGDGTVAVVDTATAQVTARLAVGGSPTGVAVLPDGTGALVTDYDHGTLQLVTTG
jgi:serine/threonine-protein kinase